MSAILYAISECFWSAKIWLPPNNSWEELAPGLRDGIQYREYSHFYMVIPAAVLVLILRYFLEKYLFAPFGTFLGIKNVKRKRVESNPMLEKAFSQKKRWDYKQVQSLAKQLDWSQSEVAQWFRTRKSQDGPSTLVKFCENSWRCSYYTCSFVFGMVMLWDKPWLWDIRETWINYPHHAMSDGVWWYYMTSLAFYWSLCISQFFDIKRKDFWEMFVHHIITITLLWLSWVTNHHRIGSLVLVVHDSADIFLEATKVIKYAGYERLAVVSFSIFTAVWFITRLGIFPFALIYSFIRRPKALRNYPIHCILAAMLILLLALHLIWTYFILKVMRRVFFTERFRDERSSSENENETKCN